MIYGSRKFNERYINKTGDELIELVKEDFGEEAAYKLKTNGYLTLHEAVECRNRFLEEHLGFKMFNNHTNNMLVGWDVKPQK